MKRKNRNNIELNIHIAAEVGFDYAHVTCYAKSDKNRNLLARAHASVTCVKYEKWHQV
jgi:hypothetical protein